MLAFNGGSPSSGGLQSAMHLYILSEVSESRPAWYAYIAVDQHSIKMRYAYMSQYTFLLVTTRRLRSRPSGPYHCTNAVNVHDAYDHAPSSMIITYARVRAADAASPDDGPGIYGRQRVVKIKSVYIGCLRS